MPPSHFHAHLFEHKAHHPYRFVILVTHFGVNRQQRFLFSLDRIQQKFTPPLQLLQENSRPCLPGKRHPRQERRTLSLSSPAFVFKSIRERRAAFLRRLKRAALRSV